MQYASKIQHSENAMYRFAATASMTTQVVGGLLLAFLCTCIAYAESPSPRDAVAEIEKVGGAVRPVAGNSGEWEVEFHLRSQQLTDAGLASIAKLKNIAVLNLRDTKIKGAGLVHLKGLAQLRRLHLERTEVGDEGMEHLSGLVNLEYLNLYGTKVTDKSLPHLAGLKSLERLYVWETGVTDEGVARLQEQRPNLKIVRGVDLSKLPAYAKEPETPKPSEDLKWIAASNAADAPKSVNGLNTQVFFENQSKKRVTLYWVSYGNELKLYGELAPGAVRQQNTFSRNTWLITDEGDRPLGYFIVGTAIARAIIPGQE